MRQVPKKASKQSGQTQIWTKKEVATHKAQGTEWKKRQRNKQTWGNLNTDCVHHTLPLCQCYVSWVWERHVTVSESILVVRRYTPRYLGVKYFQVIQGEKSVSVCVNTCVHCWDRKQTWQNVQQQTWGAPLFPSFCRSKILPVKRREEKGD